MRRHNPLYIARQGPPVFGGCFLALVQIVAMTAAGLALVSASILAWIFIWALLS